MKKFCLGFLVFLCFTTFVCFANDSFFEIETTKLNKKQIDYISKIKDPTASKYKKTYITKFNDDFYYGLPKINQNASNDDISIYSRQHFKNIKALKNYLKIKQNYNPDSKTLKNIEIDTNNYIKNTKIIEDALQNNLYDDYCKYIEKTPNIDRFYLFKNHYKIVKKLAQTDLDDEEKQKAFLNSKNIVLIENKYYKNLSKVAAQKLNQTQTIQYFEKDKYKNQKEIEKYYSFKKQYNLDNQTMDMVWFDSKKLTKNKNLIEKTIKNNTYYDFNTYYKTKRDFFQSKYFEENYNSYLILKGANSFNDEQITEIVSKKGKPCVSFRPYYRNKKDKKIKEVLNDTKTKNKYKEIERRIWYRKAGFREIAKDIGVRILCLLLCASIIGLYLGIIIFVYSEPLDYIF